MQPLLPDGILVPKCRYELRMITFLAWILRSPYTALPSITVPAVVMVRGPVYFVNALPAGTPVFEALGLATAASAGVPAATRPATRAPIIEIERINRDRLGGVAGDGELKTGDGELKKGLLQTCMRTNRLA